MRFAVAYRYYEVNPADGLVQVEVQKRVFWQLFIWDKVGTHQLVLVTGGKADLSVMFCQIGSLYSGTPITLRSDEVHPALLGKFVTAFPDSDSPLETLALAQFQSMINLSLYLEEALLQYRRDVREHSTTGLLHSPAHNSIATILALEVGSPTIKDTSFTDQLYEIKAIHRVSLLLAKHSICLELYCRYLPLVSNNETSLRVVSMASVARDTLQIASIQDPSILSRCGPITVRTALHNLLLSSGLSQLLVVD